MHRITVPLLLAGLAGLSGCITDSVSGTDGEDLRVEGDGLTRILLADAPFPFDAVSSVDVHVVSVSLSRTADTADTWITAATPDRSFDLLQLQNGVAALLGELELEAAHYAAVRVVLDVDRSGIVWKDGREATVDWQRGGEIVLNALVERPIVVGDGGGRIVLDFDVGRSFVDPTGLRERFVFVPYLRAVDNLTTGSLSGLVTAASAGMVVADASISVLRGDSALPPEAWTLVASARTDQDGTFAVGYLASDVYVVRADPPSGSALDPLVIPGVLVQSGEDTFLDLQLRGGNGGGSGTEVLRLIGPSEMTAGDSAVFRVLRVDANYDTLPAGNVAWTSSDPGVATVAPFGDASMAQVKASTAGSAVIFAESDGLSDSIYVTVREADSGEPVATIALTPGSLTIAPGDTAAIYAVLRDAEGRVLSNREIAWATSNATIVQIESSFATFVTVRGLAAGSATITATSEQRSANATVTVTN